MKKKLLALLFIFACFSLYAAPGPGGGPGGGSGGSQGGGSPGAPSGPAGPGSSRPSGPSGPSGTSPSGPSGMSPTGPGAGGIPGGGPGGSRPGSGPGYSYPGQSGTYSVPATNPNPYTGSSTGKSSSDSTVNFRGSKMEISTKSPAVLKTSVSQINRKKSRVEIYFNQTVKAESFTPDKVLINGTPLDASAKIKFNRRVDSCYIEVDSEKRVPTSIEIKEIEGYNGKKVEDIRIEL